MTLELKPLGNSCNLSCTYCYQDPMREAGNTKTNGKYDLDLMMDIADASKQTRSGYTLFGGEALLLPKKDLEKVFKRSFEKYGQSSVQTNGTLIDDEHIELFKKYNVGIGFSFDGLGELNELRKPHSNKISTDESTNKTVDAMKKLLANNIDFGMIITVHRSNGIADRLPKLLDYMRWLGDLGIRGGIIHMLEVDTAKAEEHKLTKEENMYAFMEILKFLNKPENRDLNYRPFSDMKKMIEGDNSQASCVWSSCNPADTKAVYGIEGNGQLSNCGMVNKDGIEWTKADNEEIFFRDLVLYNTPEEFGGCGGCPFFIMCNGYCTGSGINNDWRNKTVHCDTLKSIFRYYENEMEARHKVPFSKSPNRKLLERIYIDNLQKGTRLTIDQLQRISSDTRVVVEIR